MHKSIDAWMNDAVYNPWLKLLRNDEIIETSTVLYEFAHRVVAVECEGLQLVGSNHAQRINETKLHQFSHLLSFFTCRSGGDLTVF